MEKAIEIVRDHINHLMKQTEGASVTYRSILLIQIETLEKLLSDLEPN
jgi:hypothetical protein